MPTSKNKKNALNFEISFGSIGINEKIIFAKHLSVMLRAGLTISEALDIIYDQSDGRMKRIIGTIKESVDSGNSLSSSLSKYPKIFSNIFINTVYVGEASGNLDQNLENIAIFLGKEKELANKIKNAMFYPMIIVFLALGLGFIISYMVLPKILPLFKSMKTELPPTTKVLIWVSDSMQAHGKTIGVIFGSVAVAFLWLFRQKFFQPVADYLILRIPLVGRVSKNKNISIFCSTLGTLLKSGLNIDEALNIVAKTSDNYYYRRCISKISERATHGEKLSVALADFKSLFSGLAVSMMKVGERSGRLEETLFYLAAYYEEEVDTSVKKISAAIEPILLIFIGLAVGGLAMSIIGPIYQLTGGMKK